VDPQRAFEPYGLEGAIKFFAPPVRDHYDFLGE
jgi:hypothetical protein